MRLILVRHGETDWNRQSRIVGQNEIALNDTGRAQAARLAKALKGEEIAAIYSSPLRRAMETAQGIAREHVIEVAVADGLKEVDAGELDGLNFEEMRVRYGDELKGWIIDDPSVKAPGGESMVELQQRAWSVVESIAQRHSGEVVIAVSHAVAILSILTAALGMSLTNFRMLKMRVGSITILDFESWGVSLARFNDTCHLTSGS